MNSLRLPAQLYRQFDADYARDVPGEGYGGWQTVDVELAPAHTALVVMHAWDCGDPAAYPGWRRAVASPAPRRIRETNVIRLLERAGVVVICSAPTTSTMRAVLAAMVLSP